MQTAIADGDTRTISMRHVHTNEDITITYKRDGRYDEAALEKLNWFLRDWRRGKQIRMDPQLIDLLWEVQRETGSMLRRSTHGVARWSQHMLGHAVDFYIPGVPLVELRVIGLRMQRGGVGFYPTSGSPFVHMDTGGVRMWPRMTRDQLLHVFPDGRTVYIPSDGHPLSGYAVAMSELRKRGQNPTETWGEEAHPQGLDKNIVLASDERRRAEPATFVMSNADRDEDEREATANAPDAAPAPSAAAQPANPLLIALEREARYRRDQARAASRNVTASYQTAFYTSPSKGDEATPNADSSTNSMVAQSADWQIAFAVPQAVGPHDTRARHNVRVADAADATGAIAAIPRSLEDRVPPELMLAYATQPDSTPGATAQGSAPRLAQAQTRLPEPPPATTIAVKRTANQIASTILAARPHPAKTAVPGARIDDPWLDAVMISPSVRQYLTTITLGDKDYRALTTLVEKPSRAVLMKFGTEPNPGMTYDRFSGSAIVFVPAVTYAAPTHTASLD